MASVAAYLSTLENAHRAFVAQVSAAHEQFMETTYQARSQFLGEDEPVKDVSEGFANSPIKSSR